MVEALFPSTRYEEHLMEFTSYQHGTFSYVDLATSDQDAAKAFYAEVMG